MRSGSLLSFEPGEVAEYTLNALDVDGIMFRQGSFADHEYLPGTLQVDIGIVIASGTMAVVDDDAVELFTGTALRSRSRILTDSTAESTSMRASG